MELQDLQHIENNVPGEWLWVKINKHSFKVLKVLINIGNYLKIAIHLYLGKQECILKETS